MRPHLHLRKLVGPSSSVDEPVNLLVLKNFDNLVSGRMIGFQWCSIIDHIGKNHILFILVQLLQGFDRNYFILVFRGDIPRFQFGPEFNPTDVDNDADDVNRQPSTHPHYVAVDLASPDYDIGHPGMDLSEQQNRI